MVLAILAAVLLALFVWETRTFRLEAALFSRLARDVTYRLEPGPSDSISFPVSGPYDLRRGYVRLPAFSDSLKKQSFRVTRQTRFSPTLLRLSRLGISPPWDETAQAGLRILDREERPVYSATYPERIYPSFESIPGPVIRTLLFIENRELLSGSPRRNPAVEWDRLGKATLDLLVHTVFRTREVPGGSTLATQIEKYRHSEEGRTSTPGEKIRQMFSASLRSYRNGENTEAVRREVILDFVNSVPLAAFPGYGEVNGLGDGLWAWYEADFDRVNGLLASIDGQRAPGTLPPEADPGLAYRQAVAFKQMLSLFIAHRRPSAYLLSGRGQLRADTDAYLRLLAESGIISTKLRDDALPLPLTFRGSRAVPVHGSFVSRKAANAIRTRLLSLMDLEQLYDLDRVDLTAYTSLDRETQQAVVQTLQDLTRPGFADSAGLRGERLLQRGDPSGVIYSFTLYESTPHGNLLRVQADNLDQPLDINEGAKLDLGSTAKLRTLVSYLEIVWRIHQRTAGRPRAEISRTEVDRADAIGRWAIDYLSAAPDTSLGAMLEAAMDRTYSASPAEGFFTGGGLHHFVNFEPGDNASRLSVRQGIRNSVNLVFIRLMRDIARHYMTGLPDYSPDLFEDPSSPERQKFLGRFADKEGRDFLARFHSKYKGKTPNESLDLLVKSIRPTPVRLAVIFRSVKPEATVTEFVPWATAHLLGTAPPRQALERAFSTYPREAFDLADRGYIARVHPLELWLVAYRQRHPEAGWSEMVEASAEERQNVYKWLFQTRHHEAQNSRIRILIEMEAFKEIHRSWKRQGYPFDSLVPSYATAIGSSADRPAALAELMGIIVNDGVRYPSARMERLHFARGTPYETLLERQPARGERVYPVELARVVRNAVVDVVEHGTARRAFQILKRPDGTMVSVGGKTGTGDHRFETFGRGGRLIESRVVNRTATFVFLIGDRFFGTVTAYVHGERAAGYGFTSSLPVQILKVLAPSLSPLVIPEAPTAAPDTAATEADYFTGSQ